jgi:ABC-2 type transport system permease protein
MHTEETSQRAEPILASAVGRLRWAAGHLTVAFGGSALILLLGGLGLAAGFGGSTGPLLGAVLVQQPAVWLLGAVTMLLYGVSAKAATAGWAVAGACLLLGWIGPALNLPGALLDLSPYSRLPKLPGPPMEWGPVVALVVLGAGLLGAGLAGFRRRDLASG